MQALASTSVFQEKQNKTCHLLKLHVGTKCEKHTDNEADGQRNKRMHHEVIPMCQLHTLVTLR